MRESSNTFINSFWYTHDSAVKNLHPVQEMQETGFHPWVGKIPWRRTWQPLQCSCLENPMDRGAWRATVQWVAKVKVKSLSPVRLFATPWIAAHQASLSITNSRSPPKPMSTEPVMPSNHLILWPPLLLLPPIPPSIRAFSNESALCIRWPKYWSFSFSISPSNEHPGLISFRMNWLDLLAVQGTLKSLLQHHSSKASILQHSAFFIVQLSHPYITTGKTVALTRRTFVGKVMSLLFYMLSRLLITYISSNLQQFWDVRKLVGLWNSTIRTLCFVTYSPYSTVNKWPLTCELCERNRLLDNFSLNRSNFHLNVNNFQ